MKPIDTMTSVCIGAMITSIVAFTSPNDSNKSNDNNVDINNVDINNADNNNVDINNVDNNNVDINNVDINNADINNVDNNNADINNVDNNNADNNKLIANNADINNADNNKNISKECESISTKNKTSVNISLIENIIKEQVKKHISSNTLMSADHLTESEHQDVRFQKKLKTKKEHLINGATVMDKEKQSFVNGLFSSNYGGQLKSSNTSMFAIGLSEGGDGKTYNCEIEKKLLGANCITLRGCHLTEILAYLEQQNKMNLIIDIILEIIQQKKSDANFVRGKMTIFFIDEFADPLGPGCEFTISTLYKFIKSCKQSIMHGDYPVHFVFAGNFDNNNKDRGFSEESQAQLINNPNGKINFGKDMNGTAIDSRIINIINFYYRETIVLVMLADFYYCCLSQFSTNNKNKTEKILSFISFLKLMKTQVDALTIPSEEMINLRDYYGKNIGLNAILAMTSTSKNTTSFKNMSINLFKAWVDTLQLYDANKNFLFSMKRTLQDHSVDKLMDILKKSHTRYSNMKKQSKHTSVVVQRNPSVSQMLFAKEVVIINRQYQFDKLQVHYKDIQTKVENTKLFHKCNKTYHRTALERLKKEQLKKDKRNNEKLKK